MTLPHLHESQETQENMQKQGNVALPKGNNSTKHLNNYNNE
jgi:hypothetical protein